MTCFALIDARELYGGFPPSIDLAATNADVTVNGAAAYNKTGYGFACGDFDGDTQQDTAVLSFGQVGPTGFVFFHILWGEAPFDSLIDLSTYQGPISFVRAPEGELGPAARLASGDFNNDGRDDVVLGSPWPGDGKAYVVFGTESFPDTLDLAGPNSGVTTIIGVPVPRTGAMGKMLAVGDVNGDAYDDLILAAPTAGPGGQIYIVYGRDTFPSIIELAVVQDKLVRIIDSRSFQATGDGLACGDINHDGFDDLVIGSSEDGGGPGNVTLLFGSSSLPDTIRLSEPPIGVTRFYGEYPYGMMGFRVAVGNLNGDDHDDLIISAPLGEPLGCNSCGEVYVVYGSDSFPDSVLMDTDSVPMTRLVGAGTRQSFGLEFACDDVTGDGYDDILITSDPDNLDMDDVGKVTIVYGAPSLPDTVFLGSDSTVTRILAEHRADSFGWGLGAGDSNTDGLADVLIGAYTADPVGRTDAGKAYVFFGVSSLTQVETNTPTAARLFQNYPNPFNPITTISFSITKASYVRLEIFDIRGGLVRTLVNGTKQPSEYRIPWDGRDNYGDEVASGVYFYRLTAGDFLAPRKMVLLR